MFKLIYVRKNYYYNFYVEKKTELYVMFRQSKKPQIKRVWIVIYNIMMALYL